MVAVDFDQKADCRMNEGTGKKIRMLRVSETEVESKELM